LVLCATSLPRTATFPTASVPRPPPVPHLATTPSACKAPARAATRAYVTFAAITVTARPAPVPAPRTAPKLPRRRRPERRGCRHRGWIPATRDYAASRAIMDIVLPVVAHLLRNYISAGPSLVKAPGASSPTEAQSRRQKIGVTARNSVFLTGSLPIPRRRLSSAMKLGQADVSSRFLY
jgi:hypothetical protein